MSDLPRVSLEHHFDEKAEAIKKEFDVRLFRLEEKLSESNQTPWPMIVAIAAFVVTILGSFAVLLNVRFEGVEGRVRDLRGDMQAGFVEGVRKGELLATKETLAKDIQNLWNGVNELREEINKHQKSFLSRLELVALEKRLDERDNGQDKRMDNLVPLPAWESWKMERDRLIDMVVRSVELKLSK